MDQHTDFETWLRNVPEQIRRDSLWNFETYRKALYLADLAWFDAGALMRDPKGRGIAWQLVDSAGSVPADIEEGFGRGYGKDYARFLRIALGSAKEVRGWYYRGRHVWPEPLLEKRLDLIGEIISGLVLTSNRMRQR